MKENRYGKREAPRGAGSEEGLFEGFRRWSAGLTKKQRIRCRVLVGIAVVVIAALGMLRWWVRLPDLPITDPSKENLPGDVSGEEGSMATTHGGQRKGVYTFLVVGRDTGGGGNTDTMMLLTYDTKEKTLHGLNLPRDTMVNVSTRSKRLNAVYNYNKGKDKATQVEKGMTALKEQVAKLTGIKPNYYVMVEWEAIGKLVDALGGVEYEVPFDMDYDDPYQDLHIHQKAGLRTLSGDDAMQVIRHRKNNDGSHSKGDVGRLKIQQDFLKAAAKKCLQPSTFLKLPTLVDIFVQNVTTDLTVGNILALAEAAKGMDAETGVSFTTAPLGDSFSYRGAALVTLDLEKLLEILNSDMNPYAKEITSGNLELVVHLKNGGFTVTSGTLADSKMAGSSGGSSKGNNASTAKDDNSTQTPDPAGEPAAEPGSFTEEPEQPGGGEETPPTGEPTGGETTEPGQETGGGETTEPTGGEEGAGGETTEPTGGEEGAGGETTEPSGSQTTEPEPPSGGEGEDKPPQDMAA